MPPLASPADRYRAIADELAYYARTPPRAGRRQERRERVRDLERQLAVAVDAMRETCKRAYAALDDDGKRWARAWCKRYRCKLKAA